MEKDRFLGSNGSSPAPASMTDQLGCFVNLNWDQSLSSADQTTANFESALSSLVSSPTSSNPNAPSAAADSLVIRELIGRLGSICNSSGGSGEISPPNSHQQSASASCYSTPLNSPPKLNLSLIDHQQQQLARGLGLSHPLPFATDPGFVERAARYSCFGARNYNPQFGPGLGLGLGLAEPGKLSRAPSSQSSKHGAHNPQMGGNGVPVQQQDSHEASGSEGNVRKRKAAACSKGNRGKDANASKTPEDESINAKRSKSAEAEGAEKEKKDKEENAKPLEPPKQDFIHVRARRGQATDSHSLAERVRREKISERMKFLQDLVPGCNKVTGKAVMLDEIINYVQSLQRQVEFLSMKLATVNPRLDFNPDNLLSKDTQQTCGQMQPHLSFPMEATSTGFSYAQHAQGPSLQSLMANCLENQCSMNPLDAHLRRSLSMQLPSLEGFTDASSQLGAFWEDDLQSVVQMGFGQNQETVFSSQNFQGSLPTNHMKVEL